jgi:hypothetical protein
MTAEERMMRRLTNARLLLNYEIVQAQLQTCYEREAEGEDMSVAASKLVEWEQGYLDEIVRRQLRVPA